MFHAVQGCEMATPPKTNLIDLPSGKFINLDAVTSINPIKKSGVKLFFVNGQSLTLDADDTNTLFIKMRDLGCEVELSYLTIFAGKEAVDNFRKHRAKANKPALNVDVLTKQSDVKVAGEK